MDKIQSFLCGEIVFKIHIFVKTFYIINSMMWIVMALAMFFPTNLCIYLKKRYM